jgi:hypothetical protein
MSETIVYKMVDDKGKVVYYDAPGLTNVLNDPSSRGRSFDISTWVTDDDEYDYEDEIGDAS